MEKSNFYEVEGKIYLIKDLKELKNDFKKREVVLETTRQWNDKMYVEVVTFTAIGDKAVALDNYTVGDMVKITFSLQGREWNPPDEPSKQVFFNTLNVISMSMNSPRNVQPQQTAAADVKEAIADIEDDGLPF